MTCEDQAIADMVKSRALAQLRKSSDRGMRIDGIACAVVGSTASSRYHRARRL
jgi:hypothetical protein